VEELREQGVAVKILIINDSPPSRAPMGSVILSPEDILEGKVRDL
jgi:thioesterase domain-containing protein